MEIIISKKVKWMSGIIVGSCLFMIALLNIVGYFTNCKYISVIAAVAEVNKYEVRSTLLMDATNYVGACDAEEAAEVWANGLKMRSAALQYSVMTKELKDYYARQLEKTAPNWVTGMSSPWVDSFKIIKVETPSKDCRAIELRFSLLTSTGPAGEHNAVLTICKEEDFWKITKITADEGLYPYMGFIPKS